MSDPWRSSRALASARAAHPRRLLLLFLMAAMTTLTLCACNTTRHAQSPQFSDGSFHNPVERQALGWRKTAGLFWRFMFDKPADVAPAAPLPVSTITRAQLLAAPDGTLYRLGHSTVLLKLHGAFWLTDPVFSQRASPVQWAGPKRFHPAPIAIEDLPPIEAVILSHDHYDHLDKAAILALAAKTKHFLTPLGVGVLLVDWGVAADKVLQLDWWDSIRVGGVRFVATPAQHFSGRSMFAENPTLWASWVIEADDMRLFFSGDTGYFDGFKTIGDRYGPFDLTLIECGAYNSDWPDVHMQPEQTLQAHLDLRGRWLLPVHNGTFDLAFHSWHEPLDRISALAAARGVDIATPQIGQPVSIRQPPNGSAWWAGR